MYVSFNSLTLIYHTNTLFKTRKLQNLCNSNFQSYQENGGYWHKEPSPDSATAESGEKKGEIEDFDLEKSNILIIGPTGSGKTHIVKVCFNVLSFKELEIRSFFS